MKKGGKYVLVFGAVVVTLLMVSSTTAINVIQSNEMRSALKNKIEGKDEVYVDSNICLTRIHLPLLKRAVRYIDDREIKLIVLEVINLLRDEGRVTQNDIKEIFELHRIEFSGVYLMASINTEESGGFISCLPGLFRVVFGVFFNNFFSKGGIAWWHARRVFIGGGPQIIDPYVIINDNVFDYEHRGRAIGLFGQVGSHRASNPWDASYFWVKGFALLVYTY